MLYDIKGNPSVSIVIPSAGRIIDHEGRPIDLLRMCIGSILEKSTWPEVEIVVVHNCDLRPDLEAWLKSRAVLVPYDKEPFNLAEKINLGARHASGEHLIILNDDIEVIAPDWIEKMLRYSQQPGVGAVGAKLLFPNNRIQHAGDSSAEWRSGASLLQSSGRRHRLFLIGSGRAQLHCSDGRMHDDAA